MMSIIKNYLDLHDLWPKVGKRWDYTVKTSFSGYELNEVIITSIQLFGLLKKEQHFDKMKIYITVDYRYGNACPDTFTKFVVGLEKAMSYALQLEENVFSCSECSRIHEKTQKDMQMCKDCMFFKLRHDLKKKESDICSICQEEAYRFQLECGHYFHMGCISKLNTSQLKCPNCRHPISKRFIRRYFHTSSLSDSCSTISSIDGYDDDDIDTESIF
jgi:hypothetical protein